MTKRQIVENLIQAYEKWRIANISQKYWIHANMAGMVIHTLKQNMRLDTTCPMYVLSYIKRRNITFYLDEDMRIQSFRIYNDEVNGYISALNYEFQKFFQEEEGKPKVELVKDEPLIDFSNIDKITF